MSVMNRVQTTDDQREKDSK